MSTISRRSPSTVRVRLGRMCCDTCAVHALLHELGIPAWNAPEPVREAAPPVPRRPAVPLADNLLATAAGLLLLIGSGAVVLLFLNAVGLR